MALRVIWSALMLASAALMVAIVGAALWGLLARYAGF